MPAFYRWHLSGGIAYCHGDGSAWCRIPHRALCPGRTPTAQTGPYIESLRRQLAVRTRRLIDTGQFTQPLPLPASQQPATAASPGRSCNCCWAAISPTPL
ncbi:DUF6083 domain-containing protein [Streptomyces sp. NPDC002688]|uniref:DUF6083 domain-containing protein n=1 Tax=Streptomyces sp. NPDC002688 TaxID=3154423 RepID=UPI003321B8D4